MIFRQLLDRESSAYTELFRERRGGEALLTVTVSTTGEEKRRNPRLQVADRQAYTDLMNGLKRDDPRLIDFAVPLNRSCGLKPAA